MAKIKLGPPANTSTEMGPQADKTQADAVSRYLEIGNKDGHAIVGGKKATEIGPNYIQPTIFADIPDNSQINTEEVFGPVLILHEFESEAEVVRRANATECKCTYFNGP
jgi:aldehyde dehydrogenase (NAD+)